MPFHDRLPGRRVIYANSSDTRAVGPGMLEESDTLIDAIRHDVGIDARLLSYDGETHTTMMPMLIKDGLLPMYGTGKTYGDRMSPSLEKTNDE